MRSPERCYCGAPDCPSCGTAQGTYISPVDRRQSFWLEEDGPDEDEYEPKLAEREGEEHES